MGSALVEADLLGEEAAHPILDLSRSSRDEVYNRLEIEQPSELSGLDLTRLHGTLDDGLMDRVLDFCSSFGDGGSLSLTHVDLGSGGDCEQRLFDLDVEKAMRENERKFYEKKKSDSSKQKDFAASATMRREGQEGVDRAKARLEAIDGEMTSLERPRDEAPWYRLFSKLECQERNKIRHLDLADCGLHATALVLLTRALLDLEHRGDGVPVTWLVLDGNDLGDISSGAIASFLRLTSSLEALQLRNVGFTDQGVAQVVAGIVANKGLALLDLRCNGLCTSGAKEIVSGLRRFNSTCEILLE